MHGNTIMPPLGRHMVGDPSMYAIIVIESFDKYVMSAGLVSEGTKMVTLGA